MEKSKISKSRKKLYLFIFFGTLFLLLCIFILPKIHSQKVYTASELNIVELKSPIDKDNDGIDDYTDIMLGARNYIQTKPKYKSKYYSNGGYPDDGYGVCTDVIWNAFQAAGYSLKDLLDEDIKNNPDAYPTIETPDPNIDFRRVRNLKIFLERHAQILETDLSNPENWQPGDIITTSSHIMICSDKRNAKGFPFIIHHDNLSPREANEIENHNITGHFRFNPH